MRGILKIDRPEIIVWCLLYLTLLACSGSDLDAARENTVLLLTNAGSKDWVIDRSAIDDKEIIPSFCDSAYVLTMSNDFTFREVYLSPVCALPSYGTWELNKENNVISISFIDSYSGQTIDKHFEIVELTEKFLAYQIALNNKLKFVRLKNE